MMARAIESRVSGIRENLVNSGLHFIFSETSYSVRIEIRKSLLPHREKKLQQPPLARVDQPPPNFLPPPKTTPHPAPPGFSRIVQPPTQIHTTDGNLNPLGVGFGATRLVDYTGGVSPNSYSVNPNICDQCKKLTDLVKRSETLKSLEKVKTDEKIQTLELEISVAKNEVIKLQAEKAEAEANLKAKIEQLGNEKATLELQLFKAKNISRIQSEKE